MADDAPYFKHPQALVESTRVGAGTRIWAFAHVLPGATIGHDCNICDHVFIENDVRVGDRVTVKCGVQLWDGVTLEDDVFVGPNATFTNDPFPRSRQRPAAFARTLVQAGASVGANATILPNLTIGRRAIVAAGAVVTHDVPAATVVAGNPAVVRGHVDDEHAAAPEARAGGAAEAAWTAPARWPSGLAFAGLAFLVWQLWLPFGFNVGFWADGWNDYVAAMQGRFIARDHSRLFDFVIWQLAYRLSPDDFRGANFVMAALMLGKGCLCWGILRELRVPAAIAFGAAAVLVTYPADYALFLDGTLGIHSSLFAYTLGTWAFIAWWRTGRLWLALLMCAAAGLSAGTYDAALPMIAATPLLLFALERKGLRRTLLTVASWYMFPALIVVRTLLMMRAGHPGAAYQAGLFQAPSPGQMLLDLGLAYRRLLFDGWFANLIDVNPSHLGYGVSAALVAGGACRFLARARTGTWARRPAWALLGAGLAAIGLGFAPYLVTSAARADHRTFFFASVGAAVTLCGLAWLAATLGPQAPASFAVLIGLVAGAGSVHLLDQHQLWLWRWNEQRVALAGLVQAAPRLARGARVVLLDATPDGRLKNAFAGNTVYVDSSVKLLYADASLRARLCYPRETAPWGAWAESCRVQDGALVLRQAAVAAEQTWPAEELVAFRYAEDGRVTLARKFPGLPAYDPSRHVQLRQAPTRRACRMLALAGC